ncbi:MAG: twin-arginine translocase TatA/TatE family subunit [Alphaproteobacteria bacterium]|nr:twin-arginine translocase TatA/TatE family subunit [Alphaproteobacteria bacterium]
MGLSLSHLVVVLVIVLVLFGAGKLPRVMGDIGKGIRNLREGLKGEEEQKALPSEKDNTPSA